MSKNANCPTVKKIRDYTRVKIIAGVLLVFFVLIVSECVAPSRAIISSYEIDGCIYATYKNFETGGIYENVYIEDVPYFTKGRQELLEQQLAK